MNKASVPAAGTVTATVTTAPLLSRTTILALPVATPDIVRLLPASETVATLALLEVAVYGPVPPSTV